jgi:protocatechuate 4,5-dioxygenase beta chain
MAQIVGMITTSHIPAIGGAIARGLQSEPYWKPFFDGFAGAHRWLADVRPDVAVVIYNDHGLNFFLDKMRAGAFPYRRRSRAMPTCPGI